MGACKYTFSSCVKVSKSFYRKMNEGEWKTAKSVAHVLLIYIFVYGKKNLPYGALGLGTGKEFYLGIIIS